MKLNEYRTPIDSLLTTNEGSVQIGRQVGRYELRSQTGSWLRYTSLFDAGLRAVNQGLTCDCMSGSEMYTMLAELVGPGCWNTCAVF
jgi:hypothetical protein